MAEPALMDELLEEVFLRTPLDDPAVLVRAALVCRRWRRVIAGPGFPRRFREFHRRRPPMLGFLHCLPGGPTRFMPASSFRPRIPDAWYGLGWHALDARHGRVLLAGSPLYDDPLRCSLAVWDPVTGDRRDLPKLPLCSTTFRFGWNATVLCAAGAACDHLDCHGRPFQVVLVGNDLDFYEIFSFVYSSETHSWGHATFTPLPQHPGDFVDLDHSEPSALVGDSLYFKIHMNVTSGVLKYHLTTREISAIELPQNWRRFVLTTSEDGSSLGFAGIDNATLCLWWREVGPDGLARWVQRRSIDLEPLLPDDSYHVSPSVVAFAHGVDVIFVSTGELSDLLFTIDLKSGLITRVCEGACLNDVVPYMSFSTPALRAPSAEVDGGPIAGSSSG